MDTYDVFYFNTESELSDTELSDTELELEILEILRYGDIKELKRYIKRYEITDIECSDLIYGYLQELSVTYAELFYNCGYSLKCDKLDLEELMNTLIEAEFEEGIIFLLNNCEFSDQSYNDFITRALSKSRNKFVKGELIRPWYSILVLLRKRPIEVYTLNWVFEAACEDSRIEIIKEVAFIYNSNRDVRDPLNDVIKNEYNSKLGTSFADTLKEHFPGAIQEIYTGTNLEDDFFNFSEVSEAVEAV